MLSSLIRSNGPFNRWLWTFNIPENERLPSSWPTSHTSVSGSIKSSHFFSFTCYDLWQLLLMIMRGVSARDVLRDGAGNQSLAVQWPKLMNHPEELGEIYSCCKRGRFFNNWRFVPSILDVYSNIFLEHKPKQSPCQNKGLKRSPIQSSKRASLSFL